MSDTKDDLLERAAQLFEENGYKGTSIRDIARATDTSISNIYHYFGNKEGLWKEIQDASVKQLPETLRAALRREDAEQRT
ncbi:MAG: helix-turn-helix transcriptional regulator [bacterium]|nr:helix-turn-helix transcriptional regulator [bacterium]